MTLTLNANAISILSRPTSRSAIAISILTLTKSHPGGVSVDWIDQSANASQTRVIAVRQLPRWIL